MPKPDTTIIVPSKHDDIFKHCLKALNEYEPGTRKILVRDGTEITAPEGWVTIDGPTTDFCYATNVNIGIRHSSGNVLVMNDDVRFVHPQTIDVLEYALEVRPDIGIISPRIHGGIGNQIQGGVLPKTILYSEVGLCFVCVLIRKEVIDDIGLLDERFIYYGGEDRDYSLRAQQAGWKLAATGEAQVWHGHTLTHSNSYARRPETMEELDRKSRELFVEKWGRQGW
jgi:GT2 family glycosyltransferase